VRTFVRRRPAISGSAVALLLLVSTPAIALGDKSTCDDINAHPPACGFDLEWWNWPGCGIGLMSVDLYGINDEGTIVGRIDGCPTSTQYRILIWRAGEPAAQIINLPWSVSEWATDINNKGQIALRVNSNGPSIAIMEGDEITVLPKPEWATIADGGRINDHGDVAGFYGNNVTGPYPILGHWGPPWNKHADLSQFFESLTQDPVAYNNNGQIAGRMLNDGDEPSWARWRAFLYSDGIAVDLGVPPGALDSTAKGLSEAGHVVGRGIGNPLGTPGFNGHPYHAFIWKDGEFEMLEPYPVDAPVLSVEVHGINSAKTVIGRTYGFTRSGSGIASVPTVWYGGAPYLLPDLVFAPSEVTSIGIPYQLSETGIIAGIGKAGPSMIYRLTPRHRAAADLNGDCTVDNADLMILLNAWGQRTLRGAAPIADLNGDGIVDGADLGILLLNWTIE